MIRPSSDGRRLTAHLEPGGPCIAVAEQQPDGRWLVNGRAMSREHAGIALEAAVTVAAASRHPHTRTSSGWSSDQGTPSVTRVDSAAGVSV
jgi:ribosomal protein S12 methylthiotransferase accessory factor YcaO